MEIEVKGMTHRGKRVHAGASPYLELVSVLFLSSVGSTILSQFSEGAADDEKQVVTPELSIKDKNGLPSRSAEIGSELSVVSNLRNNMETKESIAYIVQIKDSGDRVIFLSITSSALQGGDEETFRTFWRPEEEGVHVVQVFVWQDSEPPASFSQSVAQIEIYAAVEIECVGAASCIEGSVTRIVDGDTMDVDNITVRFALINSPEIGESGYEAAKLFTAERCPVGSRVLVDEDDGQTSGSYGRMIAKVFCGNQVINEELLESGDAVILLNHCDESEFRSEEWARASGC